MKEKKFNVMGFETIKEAEAADKRIKDELELEEINDLMWDFSTNLFTLLYKLRDKIRKNRK